LTGAGTEDPALARPESRQRRFPDGAFLTNSALARYLPRFLLLLALGTAGCSSTSAVRYAEYPRSARPVRGTASISFVSDTQSPLWVEKLVLRSDDNEAATKKIFGAVAADSTCAALFHLGDITALGGVSTYWDEFDSCSRPIRDARIPIFPAFGNHEYMPWEGDGVSNLVARFPFLETSWYVRTIGPVAVVMLNSNFSHLSEAEASKQREWYERTLGELDADTTVTAVIVGCHHSPYTNSTIVEPSADVRSSFVPAYLKSKKAKLFVSGHAHALERFSLDGKDYLVMGGGGGLLHPLLAGKEARWPDRVAHDSDRSYFHYVRITPYRDKLTVEVLMLTPDFQSFRPAYSFDLPLDPEH
jgi:hypothetical protein